MSSIKRRQPGRNQAAWFNHDLVDLDSFTPAFAIRFDGDLDDSSQYVDVAEGNHFLISILFGTTDHKYIRVTTLENAFLDNRSFPSAAGFQFDPFAHISFHAFSANIKI
jgi:hypothetical protein